MRRPLAIIALGATIISFAPVMVKLAMEAGASPISVAFWRQIMGTAILFALALARGASLRPSTRAGVPLFGGLAFAADLYSWHVSIAYVGTGIATVLGNTQVFWAAFIGPVFFGERLGRRFLLAVLVAFGGVVLLTGVGSGLTLPERYLQGVALGLTAGLCYAVYIVILQRSAAVSAGGPDQTSRALVTLAWVSAASTLGCAILAALAGDSLAPPPWLALGWIAGLAVFVQVLGWLIISRGLARTDAARGALVILMQPALATVWGLLLFHERLAPLQLLGAGITLLGVYLGSRRARPAAPRPDSG